MSIAASASSIESQIATTFQRHYDYYSRIGNETRVQQIKDEQSIKLQYGGRATFELLQNAFDRAEQTVLIAQMPSSNGQSRLLVGNDGQSVSFDPEFDYDAHVVEGTNRRSDFHALCSLHTSNKLPDESIGNKGVGFRSVFSLSDHVRIYSRLPDSLAWWGIELHWCLRRTRIIERQRADDVREGWKRLLAGREIPINDDVERPSFYFPLPLWHDGPLIGLPQGDNRLTTIVEVPLEDAQARENVQAALAQLAESHFFFVGLRECKREVTVDVFDGGRAHRRKTWPNAAGDDNGEVAIISWPPEDGWQSPELKDLAEMAKKAEHAVSRPRVGLAWSKPGNDSTSKAKRYCYLPTLVDSPLGVDVHADFQLGIDRTTLKAEDTDEVGRYNRALLEVAAEAHLVCCLRFLGAHDAEIRDWADWAWIKEPSACLSQYAMWKNGRDDLWQFLHPRNRASDHQVRHLERLLFGVNEKWRDYVESFARWTDLASRFFSVDRPLQAFDDFWEACKGWIDCNPHSFTSHTKTWKRWAASLCDALRTTGARVVPVVPTLETSRETLISTREPLPDRPGSGVRAERRLYIRRGGDDRTGDMHLPEGLRRRGRLVSCYRFVDGINDFDASPNPTGALPLDRAALFRELRQLPTNTGKWSFEPLDQDPGQACDQQYALLKFAAELFAARFGTQKSLQEQFGGVRFTWRAEHGLELGEDLRGAGRALATMFLPTNENNWQPARQLTSSDIRSEWLENLQESVPSLDVSLFLEFLGVASGSALVLVEDGDAGIVDPVPLPPSLIEADTSRTRAASLPLQWLADKTNCPLVDAIREAWPVWLASVLRAEKQGQTSTAIAESLRELAWYPVGANGASRPTGADPTVAHLRPIDIVLERVQDRRVKVLWTTTVETDRHMLGEIGAVRSLSDDELRCDSARPATNLMMKIQQLDLAGVGVSSNERQGLLELFQTLIDAIAGAADPADKPLPLLAYSPADKPRPFPDRSLRWITDTDEGWIAEDNTQRELLRRFFPRLPVVCGTLGPKVVKNLPWLSARSIQVQEQIMTEPFHDPGDEMADVIRASLDELLPAFLAIAEVSRFTTQRINPQEINDLWATTQLRRVANVWVEFAVQAYGLERKTARWLDDSYNDAILDRKQGIIYFDVKDSSPDGPPLRAFGEALADRLLKDRRIGPAWSNAITEWEAGPERLEMLLKKSGALALAESYRRELQPLTREARQGIVERIQTALTKIGTGLRTPERYSPATRLLTPSDLVVPHGGWKGMTEETIQRQLDDAGWTEADYVFKPEFQCRENNRQTWEKWLETDSRRLRLLILAHTLESAEEVSSRREAELLLNTPMARRLAATSSQLFALVTFEPEVTARTWLNKTVNDLDEKLGDRATVPLDQLLPQITRYRPVLDICSAETANWSRSSLDSPRPTAAVLAPVTPERKAEEDSAKLQTGTDAEVALRELVTEQTGGILANDCGAWDVLSAALPAQGVIRGKFEEARSQTGPLANAIHVSATWGSAGYDLIGLEIDSELGKAEVVRYEVKALPAKGRKIRVFLSPNELAVYRRVLRNGNGESDIPRYRGHWRLVGVETDGRAVDITEFLSPLMDDMEGPLAVLGRDGFAPDGLVLSINRGGCESQG